MSNILITQLAVQLDLGDDLSICSSNLAACAFVTTLSPRSSKTGKNEVVTGRDLSRTGNSTVRDSSLPIGLPTPRDLPSTDHVPSFTRPAMEGSRYTGPPAACNPNTGSRFKHHVNLPALSIEPGHRVRCGVE
jgi:hypothetical protein